MTTEEKLEHFQQYCMESARVRSARMLDEYTQALEKSFSEHQEDARRRADMEVQAEKEKIQKETNKKLSIEQINIRRVFSRRQRELKEKLFVELRDMLANFIETPQYIEMLERQIAQTGGQLDSHSCEHRAAAVVRGNPGAVGFRRRPDVEGF